MPTGILNIRIQGTNELARRLNTVVHRDKIEGALDKGALRVERDAKRLVRVDTGRLRASIDTLKEPLTRRIGSGVVYAAAQEFGRSDLPHYGYTPYLRPALRMNRPQILKDIKEAISER